MKKRNGDELKLMNRFFQILMDVVVGIAFYFGLSAFIPALGTNATMVITLIITSVYAEIVENRVKRIRKE